MKKEVYFLVLIIIMIMLILSFSCAEKKTGDSGDDDDHDDSLTDGVGAYSVKLNMVPVLLGEHVRAEAYSVMDSSGNTFEVQGIAVADMILELAPFSDDAGKFTYEFVNYFDQSGSDSKGTFTDFDELSKTIFYEGEEELGLCVGRLETGYEDQTLCNMENGAIVTHPKEDAFDIKTLDWVNERTGEVPDHLGEIVTVRATVHVPSGAVVSGSYLKTFLQEKGAGVKIFADMSATEENDGYDGALFTEINTFEGDEIFVKGRISAHENMIEFIPVSGYHMAVLSRTNPTENPKEISIDDLIQSPFKYAGALVLLKELIFADVDPGDPATDWPEYGFKSKEIRVKHLSGSPKIGLPIYEGTGIPGSIKPEDGFDAVGAFNIDGETYNIYPRKIEDINPVTETLTGAIRVTLYGENKTIPVNLATLQSSEVVMEAGADPVVAVSLASVIRAAGITRDPKLLEYKPVAGDGRKPFETIIFDQGKSGILYIGASKTGTKESQINSHFWEGMELSDIYYLKGVSDIFCYREIKGPQEGDAEHGKGITLKINGKKYVINFADLPKTTYNQKEAILFSNLISDDVILEFTMDGSFTVDQIKELYHYSLESFDKSEQGMVDFSDLQNGYLVMADPPYCAFPDLGDSARVDDLYIIDMTRFIEVRESEGNSEIVYLRDLETESVDVGEGEHEEVVFYETILEAGGVDASNKMYLSDFVLVSSDNFSQPWPFIHDHLSRMFFRPWANQGFTTDPDLGAYGGRVSTKAVNLIKMINVPQEDPSVAVDIDGDVLWGSDANSCQGCHLKNDSLEIPIDCFSCHQAP